ncbi:hypothetical protein EJ02DRAFT_100022 [Clathrospora elynae]|uniref:Uncharacterized protein n=1 Tax=Clathrospora elynae TaxID=706981 RepID=A0A6A5SUS3_9PLEO|nr:hypothetical protein EJ02DRAFT_100022 [Clathrospora elynae]
MLRTYKSLNMVYLVKTLIHYCEVCDLVWDPRKYILFLCQHYGNEVQSIRVQLDQKALQHNFLGTPSFTRLPFEEQRRCYQILLGKEPPPVMAITPPAPQDDYIRSHSASELPRPRITSNNVSMAPNTQSLSAFLAPPRPGKTRSSRPVKNPPSPPVELAASSKLLSEFPAAARDSRSRYRPVSVPNTRYISPKSLQTGNSLRAQSMDLRHIFQQASGPTQNPPPYVIQQLVPNSGLLTASNLTPVAMVPQAERPMANPNAGFSDPFVCNAFGRTDVANGNSPFQFPQCQYHALPVEVSSTPAPYNPGQQHLKSQLGLGDGYIPMHTRVSSIPITHNPTLPQTRSAHQGPQQFKTENSGAPLPEKQSGTFHLVSPKKRDTPLSKSVPEVSASRFHLVGDEGVYQPPPEPERPPPAVPAAEPKPSSTVSKLAAAPQENSIVSKLSAEIDAVLQINDNSQSSNYTLPTTFTGSTLEESPISLLDVHISTQEHNTSRPPNSHTHPAPLTILPASLLIRQTIPRHMSPDTTPPITKTNASRYTRYYSSSPAPPAPSTVYKAYRPLPKPPPTTENSVRRQSLGIPEDFAIDGIQLHFDTTYKRDASQVSGRSGDARKLALEYRAEMPDYEEGYGYGSQ